MDSPFMNAISERIAAAGIGVARFEFAYMEKRREDGKRRGPDRPDKLITRFEEALQALGPPEEVVIGGKSMGGRIASMIADDAGVVRDHRCDSPPHRLAADHDLLGRAQSLKRLLETGDQLVGSVGAAPLAIFTPLFHVREFEARDANAGRCDPLRDRVHEWRVHRCPRPVRQEQPGSRARADFEQLDHEALQARVE